MSFVKDIEIIKKLCLTLDTKLFKLLSPQTQKFIKEIILNNPPEKFKYETLAALLFNYLQPSPFPTEKAIMGPYLLLKMTSSKYSKTIYLFGEMHHNYKTEDYKCKTNYLSINDFLTKLFLNTDQPVDFFLEAMADDHKLYYKTKNSYSGDLVRLRSQFKSCYNVMKNCKYPTTRVHYMDIRSTNAVAEQIMHSSGTLFMTNEQKQKNIPKFFKLLEEFKKETENGFWEYKNQIFLINKQTDKVPYPEVVEYIRKKLNEFHTIKDTSFVKGLTYRLSSLFNIKTTGTFPELFEIYIQKISEIPDKNRNIKLYDDYIAPIINIFLRYIAHTGVYLTECYCLARMFRKFKQVEFKNSIEPRNIVYYAGGNHTVFISKMLEDLGFNKFQYTNQLAKFPNCIDISGIWPLF